MASFLKFVSVLYLVFVWVAFFIVVVYTPSQPNSGTVGALSLLAAIGMSIPAAALFGFGQVVEDVRSTRLQAEMQTDHLQAMRSYYEPNRAQQAR